MQIKKNDNVMVISGKEKGKKGRVIAVYPSTNRLLIEKLNMIKRHTRPNQQLRQGGIVEKESPISAVERQARSAQSATSRRALSRKTQGDGTRVRVCKNCNETLS